MDVKMKPSKYLLSEIMKKIFRHFSLGGFRLSKGEALSTKRRTSIHSFCRSVRRLFPPNRSCSELNVLITTPTKRLRRKKLATMMKKMQKKIQKMLFIGMGIRSMSVVEVSKNIMSDHAAAVAMINSVNMA